jgi:Glycosyl transferase family 2
MRDMNPLSPHTAAVEIVIPVHNEQQILASSIRTLHAHLTRNFDLPFKITIADNASTDGTLGVARLLSTEFPQLSVIHLKRKGRGLALRAAWGTSDANVVAYMDVDLSTDRPPRGRASAARADRGQRLVLRHRAALSRAAQQAVHPRGARPLGR